MELPIYQVDAFADAVFTGNPAAVMPLQEWLPDSTLQALAMENNLSETAFLVPHEDGHELRWFTPLTEVELCGHATLAAAHVLFRHLAAEGDTLQFQTRSGTLRVARDDRGLTLDFPATQMQAAEVDPAICRALGGNASEALEPAGYGATLYIYEFEEDIAGLSPDFSALRTASQRNIIVSAPGDACDVVSRFFGPQVGIDEDPVTGSAHCALVPYWARRLGQDTLQARQISPRGGTLMCELRGDRVLMTGTAVTYMTGTVALPAAWM